MAVKKAKPSKKSSAKKKRLAPKKKPVPKKKLAAKKPVPKKKSSAKKAVKKAAKKPAKKAVLKAAKKPAKKAVVAKKRQDRAGHLDPHYAAGLRSQSGAPKTHVQGFVKGTHSDDDFAEELGEEVIGKATTGEDEGEDNANQVVEEERGGPFVVTSGGTEFADGTDDSNPEDAQREPFPTT